MNSRLHNIQTFLSRYQMVGLLVLFALFVLVMVRSAWVAEDAYITFRTVDNFVHGYGLTWNPAERVQVYTHPLWMFLMSGAYLFTREVFYTSIVLCLLLSLATALIVAFKIAKTPAAAFLSITIMMFSKAYVDYSASGMENPLTHLILALFLFVYFERKPGLKTLFVLSLIAGFGTLNRMDTLLLYLPILVYSYFRAPKLKGIGAIAAGFAPFILWGAFSLFYYGFLFPNSAYAKLNTGISRVHLAQQGFSYLKNSLFLDPLTLIVTATGCILPLWLERWREAPVVAGILLYLVYVVSIGGDFMSGRFFTGPILCAIVLVSRYRLDSVRVWVPAFSAVLLIGFMSPRTPLLCGADYGQDRTGLQDEYHIADERGYYFQSAGLIKSTNKGGLVSSRAEDGREARAKGKHLKGGGNIGYFGFYAGPDVHIIDFFALADPLLARLPTRSISWRVGHFVRDVPPGYGPTVLYRKNVIQDKRIAAFYNKLSLIISGDLFDRRRLREVWRMNVGKYDYILRPFFESRRYQEKGMELLQQGRIDEGMTTLQKSVALDSTRAASWYLLSRAHVEKRDLDTAYDALIRAIVHSPETYDDKLLDLGEAYANNRQLEKSVTVYQRLLSTQPDSYEAHVKLAVAYERLGMLEQAIAEFERALAIKPDPKMRNHVRTLVSEEKTPTGGENAR